MYKTAAQLWEEHITSLDWAIENKEDSCDIFLDGGCGKECFLNRYSDRFKLCIGMDTDIRQGNKAEGNIHFIEGDLENIPLKDDSVDVLLTNFVLEHIKSPETFFKEVNRVMKTNGIFIIWTPNANSISGIIIRLFPFSLTNKIKKVFLNGGSYPSYYLSNSPTKLDSMLGDIGFEKVKMEMIDGVFYFSEVRIVRWFHSMIIKLTDCEAFSQFKDLIFAVYIKSE